MSTQAAAAAAKPSGPKPGQMTMTEEEALGRKPFPHDRLSFLEHVTGGTRRLVLPDGISLAEFREHAVVYLGNYGREIHPGSLLLVCDDSNTRVALYYLLQAIGSSVGGMAAIDLLPIFQHEEGEPAQALVPTKKDSYVARFGNQLGFHVINLRTMSVKYQGLSGMDEATRLAAELMRNVPRS